MREPKNKQEAGQALIVTSAVRSIDPYLTIKDHGVRLSQLYCSMLCWITRTRVKKIVLCDNTCSEDVFVDLIRLAEEHGKRLEVLCFKGDHNRVALYGKGYGEGEIMRHVIDKSALLKGEQAFFKITGLVFVENFDEVRTSAESDDVVFDLCMKGWKKAVWRIIANTPIAQIISNRGTGYIKTIFYKCSIDYYRKKLIDCHLTVNDRKELSFENRMFMPLMRNGFSAFTIRPRLIGQSAGTGMLYGGDYSPEIKEWANSMVAPKTYT